MNLEQEIRLGEPVEVSHDVKSIGYLFRVSEKEIILCSSERYCGEDQLTVIPASAVRGIFNLSRLTGPTPAPDKPKEKFDTKILPFRPRSIQDPA